MNIRIRRIQKRDAILATALAAVVAYVGLIRPVMSRIGSFDAEIAGGAYAGDRSAAHTDASVAIREYRPASVRRAPLRGIIGKNSSLYLELRKLGVSAVDIDILTRETKRTFDWRKVRAGQGFDLYAANTGEVDSLLLYTSAADYVRVSRRDDGYVASVEQVPYEVTYHVTHGTIYNSVFASLQEQGAETELSGAIDEIFGWTIDLAKDLQPGDEYVLLYERRTYTTGYSTLGNVLAARIVNAGKEYNAIRFRAGKEPSAYYSLDGKSLQKSMRRAPLKFTHITSSFSRRRFHPVQKVYKPHYGVDYGAPRGTPVYATGDGVVCAAKWQGGNGNYIRIRHNRTYDSYYLHLSGFAKGIRQTVRVEQGQLIGYVGSTGLSTGPHLCYRITKNGAWVNPRTLDLPARDPVAPLEMTRFNALRDAYLSRMQEAILDGLANRTIAVEQPVRPTPMLRASVL